MWSVFGNDIYLTLVKRYCLEVYGQPCTTSAFISALIEEGGSISLDTFFLTGQHPRCIMCVEVRVEKFWADGSSLTT